MPPPCSPTGSSSSSGSRQAAADSDSELRDARGMEAAVHNLAQALSDSDDEETNVADSLRSFDDSVPRTL